jgi:hypothetical protein
MLARMDLDPVHAAQFEGQELSYSERDTIMGWVRQLS